MHSSLPATLAAIVLVAAAPASLVGAGKFTVDTAVYSAVYNGYQRTRLPDGTFRPETYAFGDGQFRAATMRDNSVDRLSFMQVARIIAKPLAKRGYVSAANPKETELLIMVYFGRTAGTENATDSAGHENLRSALTNVQSHNQAAPLADAVPGSFADSRSTLSGSGDGQSQASFGLEQALASILLENRLRERTNARTAQILGYWDELVRTDSVAQFYGLGDYRRGLLADIEEDRYFVILVACDFRFAQEKKRMRPLWSTRFNIRAHRHNFDTALPAMAQFAARYFGQASGGLRRDSIPVGEVEIKPLINLGEAQDLKK